MENSLVISGIVHYRKEGVLDELYEVVLPYIFHESYLYRDIAYAPLWNHFLFNSFKSTVNEVMVFSDWLTEITNQDPSLPGAL